MSESFNPEKVGLNRLAHRALAQPAQHQRLRFARDEIKLKIHEFPKPVVGQPSENGPSGR